MSAIHRRFRGKTRAVALSNSKRKCSFLSKTRYITCEKNQIKLNGELKVEAKGHLRFLKQEFERYFPNFSKPELPK